MYIVQDLRTFLCLFKVTLVISFPSVFSLHSSTNLSINVFLNLQFSKFKYSPTSHDLSHLYSQLLGLQINLLSYIPL